MATTLQTDILIAGAGPTGLALACQLVRYGVDFIILDEKAATTPYSKAIGVQARTLEIYEQIGLAQPLIEAGLKAGKVQLWEGGEARGEIGLGNIGQGLSPYPFVLIVEQSRHERLLHDFLQAHGRNVQWQTELSSFSQDAAGVTAQIKTGGETHSVAAKYLVGCDGAKSLVRHALGLEFEGNTFARLFYVADVEMESHLEHDAVAICLAQSTITAFFPIKGENRYRIVGVFPADTDKEEGEVLYEEIERQIVADTQLQLDITGVHWFSVYKVHSRHVREFSRGRCFLAGDAAHIHTPAGAQGMNTGIQDGYNLAWKLALALRGAGGEKLLKTYNQERLENARRLLETTDRVFDFGASPEPLVAYFRTHIFPHVAHFALSFDAVKHFIFPLVSQIGIQYRDSALSEGGNTHGKVRAGARMPYFMVDGASIYDRLRQPKFHWLSFAPKAGENAASDEMERDYAQRQYASYMDFHALPLSSAVTEVFGREQPFQVLLRPDNYLGIISPQIAPDELKAYLKAFAG
jgi:2-polyprenyl-6-methoxyphenol hydroxylase-like FAD-dependent oxidoreductase